MFPPTPVDLGDPRVDGRGRLRAWVRGRAGQVTTFERVVAVAIVACAVFLGLERSPLLAEASRAALRRLDWVFAVFFTTEMALRIAADGRGFFSVLEPDRQGPGSPAHTRHGAAPPGWVFGRRLSEEGLWNWFDLSIVAFSLISLGASLVEHSEFVFVARLLRVFRVFRLLGMTAQLRHIEGRIFTVIPTVFQFIMLLTMLVYIYAALASHLFGDLPSAADRFGSVEQSFLTMFQVLTLDNWTDVMRTLSAHHPFLGPLFMGSFVILTAIISLNVFIAALTNQMNAQMEREIHRDIHAEIDPRIDELAAREDRILQELRRLRERIDDLGTRPDRPLP